MRIISNLKKIANIAGAGKVASMAKYRNRIGNENVKLVQIGQEKWSNSDMKNKLEEFSGLYGIRPEKNNTYGMKSPQLFLSWFIMQAEKPEYIIESGVYKGLGTWFFEKACPGAKIHSIDIALQQRKYISNNVIYHNKDFLGIDWNVIEKQKTICFFDDHQNAVERVKFLENSGFKRMIFEDNYPTGQGDCYSFKQAFDRDGEDAAYLRSVLKVYSELPPVFMTEKTRWGDVWSQEKYPTPEPLYRNIEKDYLQIFFDEAIYYNWMCYAEIK